MKFQKFFIIIASILALLYLFLLPNFWPEPEISINIPLANGIQDNIEATIQVHSWHSNFSLFAVDGIFEVDPSKNEGNPIVMMDLLPDKDNNAWDPDHALAINRWTFPKTYKYNITLPLKDLHSRNIFVSNYLTGRINVRLRYPNLSSHDSDTDGDVTYSEAININMSEYGF
ncbi:MAG: hypothetical protein GY941_03035 [Planctomycetes bacterium]|nr:hypothetical protein [Planctomycetota bacterium]